VSYGNTADVNANVVHFETGQCFNRLSDDDMKHELVIGASPVWAQLLALVLFVIVLTFRVHFRL